VHLICRNHYFSNNNSFRLLSYFKVYRIRSLFHLISLDFVFLFYRFRRFFSLDFVFLLYISFHFVGFRFLTLQISLDFVFVSMKRNDEIYKVRKQYQTKKRTNSVKGTGKLRNEKKRNENKIQRNL
jgi:hypothetical protein